MMLLTYWRNVPEEKRHILSFRGEVSGFLSLNPSHGSSTIGHFRVHFSLYFKASLRAKSLLWISVFIHIQIIKTYYHNKNFALSLALKERPRVTQISLGGFSIQFFFLSSCSSSQFTFFCNKWQQLKVVEWSLEVWRNTMFKCVGTELNFSLSLCGSISDDRD